MHPKSLRLDSVEIGVNHSEYISSNHLEEHRTIIKSEIFPRSQIHLLCACYKRIKVLFLLKHLSPSVDAKGQSTEPLKPSVLLTTLGFSQ
jgi:hypothetical protein